MKSYIKILSFFIILSIVTSCSIFKKKGALTGIQITYDNAQDINYGKRVKFNVIANYSSGKSKNIIGKKETTIKVYGGNLRKDYFMLPKYPTQFNNDAVYISATYQLNNKTYKDSIAIPYNYKGKVLLEFNGENGVGGSKGKDGKKSIVFRDGKDGEPGGNGLNGKVGHDVQAYIWKEDGFYHIKVIDMTTNKNYFYKANSNTIAYYIYVKGGDGGDGGNGGDGGRGKDAVKTDKKTKSAGNGGDGAKGGNGGSGAIGGNVYVFIHPNASEFKSRVVAYNNGGKAGDAGKAGVGGKAGKELDGQIIKTNGKSGVPGIKGMDGSNGDVISIEIMDFDINDIKQSN